MKKSLLLAFAAMAFVAIGADGQAVSQIDGTVTIPARDSQYSPDTPPPAGLVTIFSNMGKKYPKAIYACCNADSIEGPNNPYGGHELWDAQGFTPSANHTVTRLELALGYGELGTNEAVVALYTDNGGVPGTALKTWRLKDLPDSGSCCTITVASDKAGIPVTAGTQYWVVLKTDSTNSDTFTFWDLNTTDELTGIPFAQYCSTDKGGSACTTTNDAWTNIGFQRPGLAFAVLGTN